MIPRIEDALTTTPTQNASQNAAEFDGSAISAQEQKALDAFVIGYGLLMIYASNSASAGFSGWDWMAEQRKAENG